MKECLRCAMECHSVWVRLSECKTTKCWDDSPEVCDYVPSNEYIVHWEGCIPCVMRSGSSNPAYKALGADEKTRHHVHPWKAVFCVEDVCPECGWNVEFFNAKGDLFVHKIMTEPYDVSLLGLTYEVGLSAPCEIDRAGEDEPLIQ